jgi:hypothetical protein
MCELWMTCDGAKAAGGMDALNTFRRCAAAVASVASLTIVLGAAPAEADALKGTTRSPIPS